MIHRFRGRHVGSRLTIEVQIEAAADEPVENLKQALRMSLPQKGLECDSLLYLGSIGTDPKGIGVPPEEKGPK
jgi:hypothetical protein